MEQLEQAARRLTYSFGPFLLDPAERRLALDGRDLRLSPKVFETLVLLVERHGLLVDKDDLMKVLWPDTFVEEVTLARNISLLRKALGDAPGQDQSQYIETVSKHGYRFIAEVKEVYQPEAQSGSGGGNGFRRGLAAEAWNLAAAPSSMDRCGMGAVGDREWGDMAFDRSATLRGFNKLTRGSSS